MIESKEELVKQLSEIEKWEKEQGKLWIWERIGRLPFKLLDKVTPQIVHDKIGDLLEELGNYIQSGGQYLVKEEEIYEIIQEKAKQPIESIEDIKDLPLHTMDEITLDISERRKKFATIQGASTGIGGIFTLAIDIPALLAVSLKTLQEIAIVYGYDPNDKLERIFIIKCLQISSADIVGKQAILSELSNYYRNEADAQQMISQLQGWREVVYTYRDNFGWKKLFQMVPIAGAVFGAFTNRSMVHDLAETGMMLYRKRKILERLEQE